MRMNAHCAPRLYPLETPLLLRAQRPRPVSFLTIAEPRRYRMSHRSLHVHSACGDYDVLRGPKPPGVMLTAVNAPSHHLSLDGIEEADELLMSVALHAAADNPAVENIESGMFRSDYIVNFLSLIGIQGLSPFA